MMSKRPKTMMVRVRPSPYLNSMRFLDDQYGIRREGNNLTIGNSDIIADEKGDITIGGKRFKGTRGYGNS